ncbi:MAG: serine hydrolase domain-containing protein [Gemmatimonadales bacterium]
MCTALVVLTACATAGTPFMAQLDVMMDRYDGRVPGASLLVVKNGIPIVRKSWGLADVEDRVGATPRTNYRLASVTKQFTATAILLLMEDHKLSLDDHILKWLPSLPPALESVTIQHLLTHTSGIIDYEDVIPKGATAQVHDADVLHLLESQDSTYFKPGSKYQYSNSGYSLLSLIIARASGKGFASFLHDRIFTPLGMSHTVAYENGISTVSDRAFGYSLKDGKWTRKDQSVTSAVLGDGGIYSSIDDMARWDAALYDSRLLSDESRRLAFTPHTPTDDPMVQYGFGWRISNRIIWHSGETSGFRNVIVRYPAQKLSVVILTNRDDPQPYHTALAILLLYADPD